MNDKGYQKLALLPIIIGGIIGGFIIPVLWSQNIIPQWSLFLGIIPLIIGGFITQILRSMEYKPNEPSYKCICGYSVYISSKEEHDKVCDKRQYKSILDDENE